MKKNRFVILFLLGILFQYGCMTDPSGEGEYDRDSVITAPIDASKHDSIIIVKAKFMGFELGDASHFTFEDAEGNVLDFAGCEEKDFEFAMELNADKQNEQNQGWTSNPDLKGKWFNLKYIYRNQPQYPDGPMGRVPVIVKAEMVEE